MTTINRLLVANRGEIARRVFRTCRDLGIGTVAVHSDADVDLAFVSEADLAIPLPGNTPAETYLRADLIIDAARKAGADAVHPGYGFLSEHADFARAVLDAGLVWVGPTPESMDKMGSKVEAKKLMAAAGVPVLPDVAPSKITEADLPLLVKASAGGGGRGMRIVRTLSEVAAAVEQASAEALSAFGDAGVFCEPYVEGGRHVEVQVLGDTYGNVDVIGDRDCSIQRRHQKIVEEAPAPWLLEGMREKLHEAARAAALAIGYVGAGTVEFLLRDHFDHQEVFFLEMNTRLQVEHPLTEAVTGIDLVERQIKIAEREHPAAFYGEPSGHAVEVRLYAEDPSNRWQPQSGRLTRFEIPGVSAEFDTLTSHGIRVDSGFESGDEVSTHYDAMIAKVICHAGSRTEALRRLAAALSSAQIHGVRTNRDLLVEILRHPRMIDEDLSTDFLDKHDLGSLRPSRVDGAVVELSAFAAAVALAELTRVVRTEQRRVPVGWRNVPSAPQTTVFVHEAGELVVDWYGGRSGYSSANLDVVVVLEAGPDRVTLSARGVTRVFEVFVVADQVDVESSFGHVALRRLPRFVDPADQVATGSLLAPLPGSVVSVAVGAGDQVSLGAPMLVLEAMKMQHTVTAPYDGVVGELLVSAGDQVAAGAVLAVVHSPEDSPEDSPEADPAVEPAVETSPGGSA